MKHPQERKTSVQQSLTVLQTTDESPFCLMSSNELLDAVGDELVADSLVLGEHLAETVKEVDDLLLGVGVLDEVLERVDDVLADRARHGVRGQLNQGRA